MMSAVSAASSSPLGLVPLRHPIRPPRLSEPCYRADHPHGGGSAGAGGEVVYFDDVQAGDTADGGADNDIIQLGGGNAADTMTVSGSCVTVKGSVRQSLATTLRLLT